MTAKIRVDVVTRELAGARTMLGPVGEVAQSFVCRTCKSPVIIVHVFIMVTYMHFPVGAIPPRIFVWPHIVIEFRTILAIGKKSFNMKMCTCYVHTLHLTIE